MVEAWLAAKAAQGLPPTPRRIERVRAKIASLAWCEHPVKAIASFNT
jgi:hypothetical protein